MDERDAVTALWSDLVWQIDTMKPRGIKNAAGNPYVPSYYKRGLENARSEGTVVEYVRSYLSRPPSDGFKKLEAADSLDLACEALVEDEAKPYASLFNEDDRARARKRLAPFRASIEARKQASQDRVESAAAGLPEGLDAMREEAGTPGLEAERAVALNRAIAEAAPDDVVARIRLGRAHEALGQWPEAEAAFEAALELDSGNRIAADRLARLRRRR